MGWPDSPTPAHPSQLTPPSPCPPPNLPLPHCLRVSSVSGRTGALEHKRVSTPLILHFNGPAKVIFEREWTLPWDATSGKTPVLLLIEGLRRGKSQRERREATARFEKNVTFLNPWLRRVDGQGPLRYSCDVPW